MDLVNVVDDTHFDTSYQSEHIYNLVKDFAKTQRMGVLWISVGGSRHFGWDDVHSDYDVYAVFYRSWRRYCGITKYKETYELSYQQNPPINITLYDIKKVLTLLRASNKRIIEMFHQTIIKDCPELRMLACSSIRTKPMLFGYYNAASETIRKLQNQPKRYFPTIYGILTIGKFLLLHTHSDPIDPSDHVETHESQHENLRSSLNASLSIDVSVVDHDDYNDERNNYDEPNESNIIDPSLPLVDLLQFAPDPVVPMIKEILVQKKSGLEIVANPALLEWIKEALETLSEFVHQLPSEPAPDTRIYDKVMHYVLMR